MTDNVVFTTMMTGCGIGLLGCFVSLPGWLSVLGNVLALGGASLALYLTWRDYRAGDIL